MWQYHNWKEEHFLCKGVNCELWERREENPKLASGQFGTVYNNSRAEPILMILILVSN
jgi:hypothetical protein